MCIKIQTKPWSVDRTAFVVNVGSHYGGGGTWERPWRWVMGGGMKGWSAQEDLVGGGLSLKYLFHRLVLQDLLSWLCWIMLMTIFGGSVDFKRFSWLKKVRLWGVLTHQRSLLPKYQTLVRPTQSPQDPGTADQLGTGSFQFPSVSWSWHCVRAIHTPVLPGKSRSSRHADTSKITANSTPILPGESLSHRSADTPKTTGSQAYRKDKLQSEKAKPDKTRDNQRARGKWENISNSNQGYLAPSEPSSSTRASSGYPNTPEKQDLYLKSHLSMTTEDIKKNINNSLKECRRTKAKG